MWQSPISTIRSHCPLPCHLSARHMLLSDQSTCPARSDKRLCLCLLSFYQVLLLFLLHIGEKCFNFSGKPPTASLKRLKPYVTIYLYFATHLFVHLLIIFLNRKDHKSKNIVCFQSSFYLQCLAQCLTQNRHSINIFSVNKGINKLMNNILYMRKCCGQ